MNFSQFASLVSLRRFLHFATLKYNTGNTEIIWWKSTYRCKSAFLDISKAFDKVWYKGIVHKLKLYGISGNLLKLIENYLNDRKQM